MKYNNVIFLGLCLGLTTYSALSADSVIKISGRVLDYGWSRILLKGAACFTLQRQFVRA